MATTTNKTINPKRTAAIALIKAGIATPTECAVLAGVSRQAATRWVEVELPGGKRRLAFDWHGNRAAYLEKQWRKQLAKVSAVGTLR